MSPDSPTPLTDIKAAAVASSPKPGFLSSELWLKLFAFGALLWLAGTAQDLLPQLAAVPNFPVWLVPLLAMAPKLLAGVAIPWLSAKYTEARVSLKLGATPPASDNAAAGVVNKVAA